MKKTTTISIDEKILLTAKKEIPNISVFVEECMRTYLGLNTEVEDIQEELDKIKTAKLNISILTQKEEDSEIIINTDNARVNKIWVKLWGLYRKTGNINPKEFDFACNTLGLNARELDDVLKSLKFNVPQMEWVKCDDFNTAKKIAEEYK